MFTHVMVGANDLAASKKFYDAVLGGHRRPGGSSRFERPLFLSLEDRRVWHHQAARWQGGDARNGGTIGFACSSPEQVRAFHDAGIANGGRSIEDPPGWREGTAGKLYLAYLRDPSANKIVAVHRG